MWCKKLPGLAAVVVALACHAPLRAAPALDWQPAKTWLFCVGLLEWQHTEIWNSFPECQPDRRDEQLVNLLRDAGVPNDQIVYLQDSQATLSRIEKKFVELLDSTGEGDLLIFYFCGHGFRNMKTGKTWFANYDAGQQNSSAWNVASIFGAIEAHFSGDRALLLADCCHSGALFDEARQRTGGDIAYAVLTSSYSHNSSTGHWTFTDSVLAGLRGEAVVDLNEDRVIELDELARYTALEMAFLEGQKSMFSAAERFPRRAKLAAVTGSVASRVGQRIEAWDEGRWYKAKIIAVRGEQSRVHYAGYDNSEDEWVGPSRIRPYQPAQFGEGDKVDVRWKDGKWYAAVIVKAWYGLHLVHYDGYGGWADEWVGPGQIRLRGE